MVAVAAVFDGSSSLQRRSMVLVMDYGERTREGDTRRGNTTTRQHNERTKGQCVYVYLSSGFKGQCFNYAIPIAKSYPPMTSLPYLGLVVLPLRTPRGDLARRVSN